jgi:hypothetical protein
MHVHLLPLLAMLLTTAVGGWTAAAACTTNADCADGNVCNGSELCQAGVCLPGTPITCSDNDPCTADTCVPAVGCTYTPANGCMLKGKKLRLGIGADVRFGLQTGPEIAGVAFPQNYGDDDPVVNGASLRLLARGGDGFDNVYPLPSASWEYLKGAGANVGYEYKDFHGVHGPIAVVVIRNGKPAKIKGRGAALNVTLGTNPAPVDVVLRFGNVGRRYCVEFGGRVKFFPGVRFAALAATPPSSCPVCVTAAECDDGDPCTIDSCATGVCQSIPITCPPSTVCVAGTCQ